MKEWLRDAVLEEEKEAESIDGFGGKKDIWHIFVKLMQTIWERGEIPQQMRWMTVVLIPKGGGDFRGIGLLEPFWKSIEILIHRRLQVVEFHDCLHGFIGGRDTGTSTIKAKLAQQLAHLEQELLFETFVDLKKAYDAMDRERCMEILVRYGVGPSMLRLIKHFWNTTLLVCRAVVYYGGPFQAFRGVTQGGPLSPRIFNMMVDALVREWLRRLLGEETARYGYGAAVRELMAILYADDTILASRDPVALQKALDIIVELSERVGLRTNTSKTKVMTCLPGKIRTRLSREAYNNSREGMHVSD